MLLGTRARSIVQVPLLDRETPCFRPTQAVYLMNEVYGLMPSPTYDLTDEQCEFQPGAVVFCKEVYEGKSVCLRAETLHPVQLNALVGLPLTGASRAGEMAMFWFGESRAVQTSRGIKQRPEYSLHPQCSWRLFGGDSMLMGSSDLYYPADGREDRSDFDWDTPGASRRDALMKDLLDSEERLTIMQIELGIAGALKLHFEHDYCLELMPDNSLNEEYWRLFKPGTDDQYLVATGV